MYLNWNEKTITDFSEENINSLYNQGYVFTRTGLGNMYQTRSLRIDLDKFELSSENKRILKKTNSLLLIPYSLPYSDYDWSIGKLGKDFYETKFGKNIFSANKIKELLTTEHNFNKLFKYVILSEVASDATKSKNPSLLAKDLSTPLRSAQDDAGYAICKETNELLHYCYPFYNLESEFNNLGMGMMLKAILWAKANNKKYIYLGSAKDQAAKYKLQFSGLEWFDGETWQTNLEELKNVLK